MAITQRTSSDKDRELPPTEPTSYEPKRTLTFWKLCALTFASVAGGPYGFEEAVGAGGPYLTLIGLLAVPFMWAIPNALMTAELATMMPENGGHILWVDRAFGPFWSFQNSYSTLFATIFEGGLYPVMLLDYLNEFFHIHLSTPMRIAAGVSVIAAVTLLNIRGTDVVGSASVWFTIASLGPFILIILLGISQFDPVRTIEAVPHTPYFNKFIIILLWSTSGFDMVGACAGEVEDPGKTFPVALGFSIGLTLLIDISSLAIGMSVVKDYPHWTDGTFMDVAEALGGQSLMTIFALGAAISVVGLLCTLLCSSSRIVYGMAMVGTLPKVFATTSLTYGTPWVAILLNALLMTCVLFLPFSALAEAEMWFYCFSTIMKFAALCKLRVTMADRDRPYEIPMDVQHLRWYCAIPMLLCLLVISLADWKTHVVGVIGMVFAGACYYVSVYVKGHSGSLINFEVLDE
mmetsp:Transcript_23817/g.28749  ORF Transcript_23817/g.28749 Transcript_23817/m.28749 type:complete len:461 (+) Transcript_23817:307-1689(+)|eukprot:CAMPEP_0197852944 /NCGR_PEP_ID=MMETSP1438-20131217/21771_1 /TAXON_ID=1461541 /ORGANISM="Pterosperma sp., Strain CCMP1384" /LENGTH=460 /DNA_ID=CAMNT_0043467181 /DNA_START=307 /DNA_END=1689 /DNA_ORIENTATION=+